MATLPMTITAGSAFALPGTLQFDVVRQPSVLCASLALESCLAVPAFTARTLSGAPARYMLYTPELNLMAETVESTTAAKPIEYEYVWFGGEPVAQVEVATAAVHWYFTDHLGTPLLTTDASGAVDWRVEREPYGAAYVVRVGEDRHQPLSLPGQESRGAGADYNIFRWYRAGWGRYTQVDPARIALRQVIAESDYVYATSNPAGVVDRVGLYSLSIYRRRHERVPRPSMLPPTCLGQLSCTNVPSDQVTTSCGCSCVGGEWNMQIRVEIAYDMFLAAGGTSGDPWHEQHELGHVQDIVDGLHTFLTTQESVSFENASSCESNCDRIERTMYGAIDSIARQSQRTRH
jgi:RHS repeat-associated protein